MKYLHDNGFKVLILNRFGYDASNNVLYINNNNPDAGYSRIELITTTAAQSAQSGVVTKTILEAIH
ncbi:MAG: hypothetical protein JO297_07480 [Nitrososphaeraceae archaeon]|nr:hypothetical protein [Nitrososphaeraceae archaeon]